MIETPRIAIVGVGSIGSRHINNLLAMGYQDLVGIDSRPMPHEERLPVVDTLVDLDIWKPTHALICSPPGWHYYHARYFVDRGIPVFIEKPMTERVCDAECLNAYAKEMGAYIGVGYMERAHPTVQAAKEFIEKHGCVKAEICCYWRATEKTYALDTAQESSHAIDLALSLLGDASFVDARSAIDGEVTLHSDHANGATCIIRMNMHDWPRRVINLHGEDGVTFSEIYGDTNDEWDACYKAELQAFLNGQPLCTGEEGLRVVEILEGMK